MTCVIKAGMRVDAVTITFSMIGRFFNKLRNGSFSFPIRICKNTSHKNRRYQPAAAR